MPLCIYVHKYMYYTNGIKVDSENKTIGYNQRQKKHDNWKQLVLSLIGSCK